MTGLVPRELRLALGNEGVVGAAEVARLHADGLRLGFRLGRDDLVAWTDQFRAQETPA